MKRLFLKIGWLDHNNKWDKREIRVDLVVIVLAMCFAYSTVVYYDLP